MITRSIRARLASLASGLALAPCRALAPWLALAPALRAQSFNVDFGDTSSTHPNPPVSYGGAANQPGHWNFWGSGSQNLALLDVLGEPTDVFLSWTQGFPGGYIQNNPATTGWDELLIDDAQDTFQGLPLHLQLSGLAPGPYDVYTYSWDPLSGTSGAPYRRIRVPLSPDPEQVTGGPWLGGQLLGHTYAKHFVFVSSGQSVAIQIEGVQILIGGMSNGLQIVKRDGGQAYCFGDGSGTPCPCGNNSPPGSRAGCLNSFGGAGALAATGVASVTADTLVLQGSGLPDSPTSFFQGTAHALGANGMGVPFGDGLSCVTGTTVRLGTKFAVGGVAQYPGAGEPLVSVKGLIPPGGGFTRMYQAQYRNPDPGFCTSSTFNRTNAWQVIWAP